RGSVYGNLCSALADIYPAFLQCVGEQFFQALALRYVKAHPSASASLDHYGAEFPEYVGDFEALKSLPYAKDLAQLEWYWHLAFHAKDEQPLDAIRLSEIDEDRYDKITFLLPASAHLLSCNYPIKEIRDKCLEDRDKAEGNEDQPLNLDSGSRHLLVWRAAHYQLRVDQLSDLEFELLSSINKKKNLGTILQELQSKYPLEEINQTLALAVQRVWFVGFTLAE
ncbi:DNA-binding domain-containing protein, partial [Oleiphilus sp. HI0123]